MSQLFHNYYQCGDEKFYNIFQAFAHQKKTAHYPLYKIDQEFVDSISNFSKPKRYDREYLQGLMVKRLREIRKKYNKVKLAYGGGTDSHTIVKVCADNDIHLDEVIIQMSSITGNLRTNLEYVAGLKHIKQYEGKQIGKITELHPTRDDLKFIDDPDWYQNENINAGANLPWRVYSLRKMITDSMAGEHDAIMITGHDKPRFLIEDGILYWCVSDKGVGEMMGTPSTLPLFFDKENPELTVGMAYAMLDHIDIDVSNKQTRDISFNMLGTEKKYKILEACGFHRMRNHFLNVGLLGKALFNHNRKNKRFINELRELGEHDFLEKIFDTHKRIFKLYGDLPDAINNMSVIPLDASQRLARIRGADRYKYIIGVQSTGRRSQKVPILQDKFGS